MGIVRDAIETTTESVRGAIQNSGPYKVANRVIAETLDARDAIRNTIVLALSKAWIGISRLAPAQTNREQQQQDIRNIPFVRKEQTVNGIERRSGAELDRYDYTKLYSLQIGDYFMPMSQTFSVKARKRLNVSALVDGPDIIQQTRKEAKTINCTLRLTLRNNQPNLQIMERLENEAEAKIAELSKFLNEFYEKDQILRIRNQKINETHGIEYAIITEYTDTPRVGMGTYQFEFTLTEVKYGENVVTFNLREVDSDAGNY